mgnify:CR=1 FL=1
MQVLNERRETIEVDSAKMEGKLTMEEFAQRSRERADSYIRYHIDTAETDDKQALPNRFLVKVGKVGLAKFILTELFQYWGKWDVITSRPCTYGVFSGPVGGFSPRPALCVGCLRCTIQHPDFVTVEHNPARNSLGDSYMTPKLVSTIDEEARKGTVPVRGQGYRGRFGGPGWDQMFTDMSEIVRPSRDGIHGRELISTVVDIGSKPMRLSFDSDGSLVGEVPKMLSCELPFMLGPLGSDTMTAKVAKIWKDTAEQVDTLAFLPIDMVSSLGLASPNVVPILDESGSMEYLGESSGTRMVEMRTWNPASFDSISKSHPGLIVSARLPFQGNWKNTMMEMVEAQVPVIHFQADGHGYSDDGSFVMDLMMEAHNSLIEAGNRDKVTFLLTGGVVAADHLPKAIICGLDAVVLDLPLIVAIQGRLNGNLRTGDYTTKFPRKMKHEWAVQRLVNLSASWRDQLLEILGAMGIREVRRLRGEMGRAMWCGHLEEEAFADIEGFVGGDA